MKNKDILLRDKCPVCDSTSFKLIFDRSFDEGLIKKYMEVAYQGNADIEFLKGVLFEIVKCKKCDLAYQKYVLSENKLIELYNKWIDPKLVLEWRDKQGIEIPLANYTKILHFSKNYLNNISSSIKVLDYGAGFGDSLILAKEMGFDAYALEYSKERISFLEEKGIDIINDNSKVVFDLIICNQVLEHVTSPSVILQDIHSKLNKNGLAYIAVPNCPKIEKQLEKTNDINDAVKLHEVLLDASVAVFQHINYFKNSNLKLLYKSNGFKQVSLFKMAFIKPLTIKSILRPFYRNYFSTGFFLRKID